MVGNIADAHTALTRAGIDDHTDLLSLSGSTRVVYLINGVVYKVEFEENANASEFDTINNTRHILPQGFYYPEVSMFSINGEDVIAMEYIDGIAMAECFCFEPEVCDATCAPPFVVDTMTNLSLDTGGFNVVDCEGVYYIIDAN